MEVTIGDIMGGIVAEDYIDNVALSYSYGEAIAKHGRKTKQLKEDDTFIAFAGAYRWRPQFIEEFFT